MKLDIFRHEITSATKSTHWSYRFLNQLVTEEYDTVSLVSSTSVSSHARKMPFFVPGDLDL